MNCVQCGAANPQQTNGDSATDIGETFVEDYECHQCGAKGSVSGEIGGTYEKEGALFNSVGAR